MRRPSSSVVWNAVLLLNQQYYSVYMVGRSDGRSIRQFGVMLCPVSVVWSEKIEHKRFFSDRTKQFTRWYRRAYCLSDGPPNSRMYRVNTICQNFRNFENERVRNQNCRLRSKTALCTVAPSVSILRNFYRTISRDSGTPTDVVYCSSGGREASLRCRMCL